MSNILTIPLRKSLPSLRDTSSQAEWGKILCDFLKESQSDISELENCFQKNIEILEHQKNQTTLLIGFLEECGGLAIRARNMMTSESDKIKFQKQISEFADWFKIALGKLDKAVSNSEYQGINLMNGGSLITPLDKKGQSKLVTEGIVLTSTALGIRDPDFSTMFTTQNARIDVMNAIDMIVTVRNIIASHISIIQIGASVASQSKDLANSVQNNLAHTNLMAETKALLSLSNQEKKILGEDPLAEPAQQETLNNFASSTPMEDK